MAQVDLAFGLRATVWRGTGLALVLAAAAIASQAEIVVVGSEGASFRRISLLPAGPAPWVAAAVAVATAALLVWALARFAGAAPARSVSTAAPLALLGLWVVPLLPVLADRWPMLLLLAGPLRWVVAVVAAGLVLWRIERVRLATETAVVRVGPRAVVGVSLLVFVGVGAYVGRVQGLDGDEPHYLMIAQSLLADGDLAIENNYLAREFEAFSDRELRPPFLRRGLDGVIYSVHAPGLPVLLLPAYALGGARGAIVFLGLVAALAALAIYRLARELAGPRVALAVWAGVALGTPFLFHGWLIYPEMPAAFVTAWAAWWTLRAPPAEWKTWVLRGVALAALPWFHTKFAVLTAGLGATLGLGLLIRRQWPALVAVSVPVAVSTAGWFAFFWVLYGVADPTIPYGGTAAQGEQLMWANVPRGVLGLLFDQEFGLLVHSPVYVLAPLGLAALMWRRDTRWPALALVATALIFVVSSTRYYMWWGGTSVPARFLIPVLPMIAPGIAVAIASWRGAAARGLAAGLLLATLLISLRLVVVPEQGLAFNWRDGSGKFVEWLGQGSLLVSVLPSLWSRDWVAQLPRVLFAVGVVIAAMAGGWLATRRPWRCGPAGALVGVGLGGLLGATVLATPLIADGAPVIVRDGRTRLLDTLDGRRTRVVDLRRWQRIRGEDALAAVPLVYEPNVPEAGERDLTQTVGPIVLSPGRYDLSVRFRPGERVTGRVAVTTRAGRVTLASAEAHDDEARLDLVIPPEIVMTTLWVTPSDAALADAIDHVEIRPRAIVPRTERGGRFVHQIDWAGGTAGGYYAHVDRLSFAEGGVFWTRGSSESEVLLYPGRAALLVAWLQAGAAGGRAEIDVAGDRRTLTLEPGERRPVEFRLPGVEGLPVRVGFDGGFRPSEVEAGSKDTRWLGVRVAFELYR